jgi:dTDP-4-dehydrorhamnose reductase
VRTSWLYGKHGKNFVLTIVKAATQGGPLRVVADQRGTPTYAADLALAIRYLLGTDLSGIVHAAGEGTCSWHEFATAIVEELGLSIDVQAITSAELGRPAPRPANSALSTYRLAAAGWTMPGWRDALKRFLKEEVMPAHAGR